MSNIEAEPFRITSQIVGGHWLVFDFHKEWERYVVAGCHCGFRADLDSDVGWGDSVIDHIWNAARSS